MVVLYKERQSYKVEIEKEGHQILNNQTTVEDSMSDIRGSSVSRRKR